MNEIHKFAESLADIHKKAKRILEPLIQDLIARGMVDTSVDTAMVEMLINSMDIYYRMMDEIKATGYTTKNARNGVVQNPLLPVANAYQKSAMHILEQMGGSKKSRLFLGKRELQQAEDSPFDTLLKEDALGGM